MLREVSRRRQARVAERGCVGVRPLVESGDVVVMATPDNGKKKSN